MNQEISPQIQDIKFVIEKIYSEANFHSEDYKNLKMVAEVFKGLNDAEKNYLMDMFFYQEYPFENLLSLYFYLIDISGDLRFLNKIDAYLEKVNSIGDFYEIYWNISRRSFLSAPGFQLTNSLRRKYQDLSYRVNDFINRRFSYDKKTTEIKRIAILSPQILGMRHSPTREVFSMACHLRRNHDVEVFVINTNALIYESRYAINDAFIGSANRSLEGEQELVIDYLDFKQERIKLFSWPAGRMSLQKIIDIQDVVRSLNVDAIISHADNLFVQESFYGKLPSIFVTTGGVVPFAHSDAYWIPGNLMTNEDLALATTFGHSNFLYESMMVTPEGEAEVPANKKSFDIPRTAFVYLVVSTRLSNEIDAEFIAVCSKLLQDTTNSVILFVGTPDIDLARFFDNQLISEKRVINGGFRDDLAEVCLMSNVYLNPKRQGGGTSSQTAMMNGLPVVTLDHGHISAVVPEAYRHSNWDSYFDFAKQLNTDPLFLENQRQIFGRHFKANLKIDDQIAKIYNNLNDTLKSKYL